MSKTFFLFDRVPRRERPYPNIAVHEATPYTPGWRGFSTVWPYSEPCGFYDHCINHGVDVQAVTLDHLGENSAIYPISLSFFDHSINHLAQIRSEVKDLVRQGRIRIVIFYTEGDDPRTISEILREQEYINDLPLWSTYLVSANSAANMIRNAVYFADDEFLFRQRNRWHTVNLPHKNKRPYTFTCLSRTHKWWRAASMAAMYAAGWLDHAIWSYDTRTKTNETIDNCPISIHDHDGLYEHVMDFLSGTPYRADNLDSDQHNDHEHHVSTHFDHSYFQVILETHFDADSSGGTFLTEKTFKAIKNGQPFVIFGPAGTLSQLRSMGYRTFDHVIDNRYDSIQDNNQRWLSVLNTVKSLVEGPDLLSWYHYCYDDTCHNQQIFLGNLSSRLNNVLGQITQ